MDSLFFTNPILLSFGIVALFSAVASFFVTNKKISAVIAVCGAAVAVFCVTYALLLGASLYETLTFILVLAAISALSFLPRGKAEESDTPPESMNERESDNNDVQAGESQSNDGSNIPAESGEGEVAESKHTEPVGGDTDTEQISAESGGRDGI